MWMIRAGRGGQQLDEFLREGVAGFGDEKLGALSPSTTKDDLLKRYAEHYPEEKEGSRASWASQLVRLLAEMKVGDEVITNDRDRADLPVAEIVAKAKEAGMTISPGLVYNVKGRLTAKATTKPAKKPAKKTPAKKVAFIKANAGLSASDLAAKAEKQAVEIVSLPPDGGAGSGKPNAKGAGAKKPGPKPKAGGMSASEFVRSQPVSVPAKEVVASGAKQGLKFSDALDYMVRSKLKAKRPGKAPARKAAAPKTTASPKAAAVAPASTSSPEAILSRLVIAHGIGRVRELLAAVEKRIERLLASE